MPQPLDQSVALITGATSGIGLAAARAFSAKGCKVVLSGRREELGETAAKELRDQGGDARFVQADVDVDEQLKALVEQTVEHYGRLDIAFNNAGSDDPPAVLSLEQYSEASSASTAFPQTLSPAGWPFNCCRRLTTSEIESGFPRSASPPSIYAGTKSRTTRVG